MKNNTMIKYILLCFIISINSFQAYACFWGKKVSYTVHVVNNLPPNTDQLVVHCASKNDELGYYNLTTKHDFHFHFCKKPKATLFFCHLWWGNKNKAFEVFNARWDPDICVDHTCYWEAQGDGIYFSGTWPPGDLAKAYNWE
ncbi:hypothetical protein ACP275_06G171600 [Erythranthe tilingii]